jgi:hypothetical protein
MNLDIDPSVFPPRPTYAATGAALLLEPIMGSGERLCVAVAAHGADGAYRTAPVLHLQAARCLVGEQADSLIGFMRLGIASLEQHFAAGGTLTDWRPPVHGLLLGHVAMGHVADLPMMLRTVARNHAFLATLADFTATTPAPADDAGDSDRWLLQVRQSVTAQRPTLEGHFSRRLRLVAGSAETRFDYVGQRFAAQLSRLVPGPAIGAMVRAAKAKLWDLEALRDVGSRSLFAIDAHELLLYRPHDDDPTYSERAITRLHEALAELEAAGNRQALPVRPVSCAAEAAERIIQAEAA